MAVAHWSGRVLYHRATWADRALAAAHQDARDQFVILSRTVDAGSTTAWSRHGAEHLTAWAGSGRAAGSGAVRTGPAGARAERTRRSAGPPAGRFATRPPPWTRWPANAGTRPDGGPGGAGARAAGHPASRSAGAIAHAAREALANVAAHAGTGQAWVTARRRRPDGAAALAGGGDQATCGTRGWLRPRPVDPARLGVRRSITERVSDWGGRRRCGPPRARARWWAVLARGPPAPGPGWSRRTAW